MRMSKEVLRGCARIVLEDDGYQVSLKPGPGIVAGARLSIAKGSTIRTVAVRTSVDRDLGLVRRSDGQWRTIMRVGQVIVSTPSSNNPNNLDVFSFDPKLLMEIFDDAVKAKGDQRSDFRLPVFIALDDKESKSGSVLPGLSARAQWRKTITPNEDMLRRTSQSRAGLGFIERVKREFAEINGVDVSKVVVDFRIVA
jgi:hypothetical protein